jgi:hypothetical protein
MAYDNRKGSKIFHFCRTTGLSCNLISFHNYGSHPANEEKKVAEEAEKPLQTYGSQ